LRAGVAAAVLVVASIAASQASASVIPKVIQAEMRSILEQSDALDYAFIPTYAPKRYVYAAFGGSPNESHITLSRDGVGDPHSLYWTIGRYGRHLADCGEGKRRTLRVDGRTVYFRNGVAWRCLRAPSGRLVVVKVHGDGLSPQVLGAVAASAARI
jgi:hypothetical protein